jgi:hypothetical protein
MPIRPFFNERAILRLRMRRLVLIMLVLGLSLPAAALALRELPGDGTLVVDNARGVVTVRARGGIIGRFDSGRVTIVDPIQGDGGVPVVYGWERETVLGPRTTRYEGEDVRFRLIGGTYRVTVQATGMDISAVGRGSATVDGTGFSDQLGRYQINGGIWQPMPDGSTALALGRGTAATTTTTPSQARDKDKPQGPGGQHG